MRDLPPDLARVYLKPGELHFATGPTVVSTVLGSCVSVTMFDRLSGAAAICHALLPEGPATFMHDPTAGKEPWQRLTVPFLPTGPFKNVGGSSAWQMEQDVRMLADLARTPFAVPATPGAKAVDPKTVPTPEEVQVR